MLRIEVSATVVNMGGLNTAVLLRSHWVRPMLMLMPAHVFVDAQVNLARLCSNACACA
jgi:hypothetical protein